MSANDVKTREGKETTSKESTVADFKKVRVEKINFCGRFLTSIAVT